MLAMTKKPLFKQVTIIGVGLIGGSIGLAVKKRRLAKFVVGVVRKKATAIAAVEKKAVDMATFDLNEAVAGADLVILCTPVSTIIRQMKEVSRRLKKDAVVIDVGSSKVAVEKAAKRYFKRNEFVGCHPMTGSALVGVAHAEAGMFKGSQCFVVRRHRAVESFWRALGCQVAVLDAHTHDAWVAKMSYLPHLLAFSLFQEREAPRELKALNPSVRELARLAKSDPALWSDILFSNEETLPALLRFEKNLRVLKKALGRKNSAFLRDFILKSNRTSAKLVPGA